VGDWLLTSTIVLWIVGVVLLAAGAVAPKVSFAGPPTVYQRNQAAPYEITLALVLTGIPVLAAVLAAITRHTVTVIVLLVVTALLVAPAVYIGRTGVQDQRVGPDSTPAPTVTRCVPLSGSTHGCPGG
jgi:hypothetical protein